MASELRVNTITSTTGVGTVTLGSSGVSFSGTPTFNDVTLSSINGNAISGTRNRIINGDMRIDQRNAGASVTVNSSNTPYCPDRFNFRCSQASGAFTAQQSSVAPTEFNNSVLLTVTNTTAPGSADRVSIRQIIEGYNISDLGWGTASAKTVTLSFWVRSSLVGTYGVGLINSAENRSYVLTYSISVANTWEFKTLTVPGDTSGTWLTTNSNGIRVTFDLGSGTSYNASSAGTWVAQEACRTSSCVNWQQSSGATFYITGVQLEPGSVATPFERRSFGAELALCQRYFAKTYDTNVAVATAGAKGGSIFVYKNSANEAGFCFQMPVEMRSIPTIALYSHAGTVNRFTSSTTDQTSSTNGPINGTRAVMSYGTTVVATDCYQHFTCSAEL